MNISERITASVNLFFLIRREMRANAHKQHADMTYSDMDHAAATLAAAILLHETLDNLDFSGVQ